MKTGNRPKPGGHAHLPWSVGAALLVLFNAVCHVSAQPSLTGTNDAPLLAPPYGRIEPTFWESYGTAVIAAGIILVLLVALAVWLALRPRRIAPPAPGLVARQQLAKLDGRPEDGPCLSAVSQVLRRYFIFAFRLADGELNTSEFCAAISARPDIGAGLATPLTDFLRQCDERKFSPAPGVAPLGAVHRAQDFLAQAEAHRAATRQPPA
jgi:hypothetical protein